MTIKQFIEKAIEGGWKAQNDLFRIEKFVYEPEDEHSGELVSLFGDLCRFSGPAGAWRMPVSSILLDPEAWRAVGKVGGWGKELAIGDEVQVGPTMLFGCITSAEPDIVRVQVAGVGLQRVPRETVKDCEWKRNMHRMIEALAEGKDAEQFIETL